LELPEEPGWSEADLRLSVAVQSRVAGALLKLAENPRPNGVVKLKGGAATGYASAITEFYI
jgi:hypothetical protein